LRIPFWCPYSYNNNVSSSKPSRFFSNIKAFTVTYSSTIKIAWQTNKWLFLKLTLVNAVTGALVYPTLLVTKMLIDAVITSITTGDVNSGIRTMVIAAILGFVIDQIAQAMGHLDGAWSYTMANLVSEKVGISIARKINALPVGVAELPETRNALQKVEDNTGRSVWSLIIPISSFPDTIFTILSAAIPIVSYQPLLIIPCIVLAIPRIAVGVKHSRNQHLFRTGYAPLWRVWRALEDFTLKGKYLYENKILDHVDILLRRRSKMAKEFYKKDNDLRINFAWKRQVVGIPVAVFETGTKLYLYYQAIIQVVTLGTAQITSSAISRFIGNITRLISQINDVYQNYLFIQDYEKFMALEEEDTVQKTVLSPVFTQGIEFKNVWFKYNSSPHWILKDVSFKIDPKENLALVGENGAGKTTIIKLLCRFYEPQRGEIQVNGLNIRTYNLKNYRHALSALFQDFAQYPFSAKDNIHFGDITKKSKIKDIKNAAKLTGIHQFTASLPLRYNNPLDKEFDKGIEPSKGQWQRIALARALFRDSPILILDEPTSNVDPETEEQIFEDILRVAHDKIIFLVSHRFSTVRKADKILVLEYGEVKEYGSHEQLMKNNGRYRELFELQAKSYR